MNIEQCLVKLGEISKTTYYDDYGCNDINIPDNYIKLAKELIEYQYKDSAIEVWVEQNKYNLLVCSDDNDSDTWYEVENIPLDAIKILVDNLFA